MMRLANKIKPPGSGPLLALYDTPAIAYCGRRHERTFNSFGDEFRVQGCRSSMETMRMDILQEING